MEGAIALVKGKKYKVRYRLSNQRRDREGVAVYLGLSDSLATLVFSGRPEFGTTDLRRDCIINTSLVDDKVQCYMDKKVN